MSARAAQRPPGPLDQWIRDVATVVGLRATAPIFAQRSGPRWPQAQGRADAGPTDATAGRSEKGGVAGNAGLAPGSPDVGLADVADTIVAPLAAAAGDEHARSASSRSAVAAPSPHPVEIQLHGEIYEVLVDDGQTLLEAARIEGIDLPFSCASGGCGACRVRLLEGRYEVEEPNCLSAGERAEGYVLACVGRPRSACRIEADA